MSHPSTRRLAVSAALGLALSLGACQSVGQNAAIGAGAGALIGGVGCALAGGNERQCLAIAGAGALIGGTIGAQIDARDRQRREAALMEAVREDEMRSRPLAPARAGGRPAPAPKARTVAWRNPDTGNSGSITPLRGVLRNSQECKVMQETYFKDGNPVSGETTVCRQADGGWR